MLTSRRNSFLGAILTLLTQTATAVTTVEILADSNYPPYSFVEHRTPVGIYSEIIQEAGKRMKDYHVVIKALPWTQGLKKIRSGQALGIYPPYHRTKQRPYIWPYSFPLGPENFSLICAGDKAVKIVDTAKKWPHDFKDLTLGVSLDFAYPGRQSIEKQKKPVVQESENARATILLLARGKVNCVINDYHSLLHIKQQLKNDHMINNSFRITKVLRLTNEMAFIGYSRNSGKFPYKQDFVEKMDQALYELYSEGITDKIRAKYLGPG